MPTTPDKIAAMSVGATMNAVVSFANQLGDSETLATVDSVVEVTSSDLTLANKAVNTAVKTVERKSVAIGKAAQFTVSGQSATGGPNSDGFYTITVTVTTDSTPAQTLVENVQIQAE